MNRLDKSAQASVRSDFCTVIRIVRLRLSVPAMTSSPTLTTRGIDSPVNSDASTSVLPKITLPSAGIVCPLRTSNVSPIWIASMAIGSAIPCTTLRAVPGVNCCNRSTDSQACCCCLDCNARPTSNKKTTSTTSRSKVRRDRSKCSTFH